MFKVICVNSGTPGNTRDTLGNKGVYCPDVFVGSEYTVVDEYYNNGELYYELFEVPADGITHYFYSSKMFATYSTINEQELVNTKEECV